MAFSPNLLRRLLHLTNMQAPVIIAIASLVSSVTLGTIGIIVARLNNPIRADDHRFKQDKLARQLGARMATLSAILMLYTDNGKLRDRSLYAREEVLHALECAFGALTLNCAFTPEQQMSVDAYEAWREYRWNGEDSPFKDADFDAALQLARTIQERTRQRVQQMNPRTNPAYVEGYFNLTRHFSELLEKTR